MQSFEAMTVVTICPSWHFYILIYGNIGNPFQEAMVCVTFHYKQGLYWQFCRFLHTADLGLSTTEYYHRYY